MDQTYDHSEDKIIAGFHRLNDHVTYVVKRKLEIDTELRQADTDLEQYCRKYNEVLKGNIEGYIPLE